ncbi:MAG TPA: hypothetical protein VFR47_17695 [Anaerolineales bacterium]|nr:hypothetical protein [Anaerolineales bacterium]
MSNPLLARYNFLPWSRQAIAGLLTNPDPLNGSLNARISLPVRLQVNAAHNIDLTLRLYGPGDVVGLDPRQVIRTEPRNQTKDYIPNYFPAVEFARPDLPWLFMPAAQGSQERLRPWMVLVVVERKEGVTLRFGRQLTLPVLEITGPAIPGDELPPLQDAWAWAHVQVSGAVSPGHTLEQIVANEPHNVCSRLICPRKLLPNRDYFGCVVPVFDAGRKAGLGLPGDDAPLASAWESGTDAPTSIQLPVYYHWEFSTGSAGDFEALAKLLQPRIVPSTVGMRPMDISHPGFGMPEIPPESPGHVLGLEGALRAPIAQRTDWPEEARAPFQAELTEILNAPQTLTPQDEPGPLIAPPLYARWHAAQTAVPADQPVWFRQLNLDPRERTVSGFGTRVVQDQQENLMQSAWEQIDEVLAANRLLIRAQVSRSVGVAILEKDLNPLPVDALLQITRPMHPRLRMSPVTLHRLIADSKVPAAAVSHTFRRIARPRGPLARRIYPARQRHIRSFLRRMNADEIAAAPPRSKPSGTLTPAEPAAVLTPEWLPSWLKPWLKYAFPAFLLLSLAMLFLAFLLILVVPLLAAGLVLVGVVAGMGAIWSARNRNRWRTAETLTSARFTPAEIQAIPGRPDFRILSATDAPPDASPTPPRPPQADSPAAARFREAAAEFQAVLARSAGLAHPQPRPALILETIQPTLLARLDPEVTVLARMQGRISIPSGIWEPPDPLEPIMAYPKFDRPMYEPLRDLSQELLLPGLEVIKPNTVTLLETNPRFIEAYMVGINHEMGRELLWREFPTDQRGSYFRQFWDVRGRIPSPRTPEEREQVKDIPEIHAWKSENDLGENLTGGSPEGRLVLLVRGELLRRFPTAMIYACRAQFKVGDDGRPTPERELTAEEKYPLFRGTLDPDVTFIGFDLNEDEARGDPDPANGQPGWFLVIQEQPTEPRFGLDVATDFADTLPPLTRWNDLSWGHLAADQTAFDALTHIRLGQALPDTSGVQQPPGVAWGENAAHMAFITLQKPVRIGIHADDMLPAE